MNDNIDEVFLMVGSNELDSLKNIVNKKNVNLYINEMGQSLLHEAIAHDSLDVFKYLLSCKIDVNKVDKNSQTPLHFTAAYGNYEFTKLLLDSKGVKKAVEDRYGNNPLWVAAFYSGGNYDVVKLLKEYGVDSYSKNKNNKSALDYAVQIKDPELEKILVLN